MNAAASRRIVVAGGGIAGLTAALAFASKGFDVAVFDRAPRLEETGAGLQLSPNATRLLDRLGVLDALRPSAVRPDAVVLRDGLTLKELARVPLGDAAERRWGAPYLVAHRADLQRALLARVATSPGIRLRLGTSVGGAVGDDEGLSVLVAGEKHAEHVSCRLLVGADGVHSTVRDLNSTSRHNTSAAETAWRTTVVFAGQVAGMLGSAVTPRAVTAFLRPGFHLIAYPVRAGSEINLVAFTRTDPSGAAPDRSALDAELARCAAPLRHLSQIGAGWTCWPLRTVDPGQPWTDPRGIALIGDAAHAITPYAAQGAAMAIEDAVTLADAVAAGGAGLEATLSSWESRRRPRIAKVVRRAAFNRLAWHAAGPVALARNLILAARSGTSLAADMDWLYGYRVSSE